MGETNASKIIIYGAKGCAGCMASKNMLARRGVAFEYKDIGLDNEAADYARGLGFTSLPVIECRELNTVLGGFNPGALCILIDRLIERFGEPDKGVVIV